MGLQIPDKEQKTAVAIDVATPSDGNIKEKVHEKIEKHHELKEELGCGGCNLR